MAVDAALFGSNSLFRVYPERDALVFLRVGSFFGPIGVEVGRKGAKGGWFAATADAAKPMIGGGVLVAAIVAAISLRIVLRSGGRELGGVLDVLTVFGVLLLLFGLAGLFVIRMTVRKAAALDAMTAEQRREEVGRDRRNRLLRADDVEEASLDKASGGWGTDDVVPTNMTLTLRPNGKRKLRLEDRMDAMAAVKAVRRLIGRENVRVNVPLGKRD